MTSRILLSMLLASAGGCTDSGRVLLSGNDPVSVAAAVSAGQHHTCAVVDGVARCWGGNDSGELGLGHTNDELRPRLVSGGHAFHRIAAGEAHTCALDAGGDAYCWGGNARGQLGSGDRVSSTVPRRVALPGPAVNVTADYRYSCALLRDGGLYCWGENFEGQLGLGDVYPGDANPTAADGLTPALIAGHTFQAVDAGQGHTCAIRSDGTLWCWGRNSQRQVSGSLDIQFRAPVQVGSENDWIGVQAAQAHSCAMRADRSLWCWGTNNGSDSGAGNPFGIAAVETAPAPVRVAGPGSWDEFRSESFHACAIDLDDALHCWGRNREGQLAVGDLVLRATPVRVADRIAAADVGRFSTCVVDARGAVLCAGKNDRGELGLGDNLPREKLTRVEFTDAP